MLVASSFSACKHTAMLQLIRYYYMQLSERNQDFLKFVTTHNVISIRCFLKFSLSVKNFNHFIYSIHCDRFTLMTSAVTFIIQIHSSSLHAGIVPNKSLDLFPMYSRAYAFHQFLSYPLTWHIPENHPNPQA